MPGKKQLLHTSVFRYSLILIGILIASNSAWAQKKIYIPENGEWFHFEFTSTQYQSDSKELSQEFGHSISFALMNEVLFGVSHWSFGYGLGFGAYNYNNNLNIKVNPTTQLPEYQFLPADSTYDVNRQSLQYIEVPLELRFRTRSNKKGRFLRIYPFIKGGVRVKSLSIFKNGSYSVAQLKLEDTEWWRAAAGIRLGYSIFSLYANYEISSIYKSVQVGETNLKDFRTLNLGVSLSL